MQDTPISEDYVREESQHSDEFIVREVGDVVYSAAWQYLNSSIRGARLMGRIERIDNNTMDIALADGREFTIFIARRGQK